MVKPSNPRIYSLNYGKLPTLPITKRKDISLKSEEQIILEYLKWKEGGCSTTCHTNNFPSSSYNNEITSLQIYLRGKKMSISMSSHSSHFMVRCTHLN